MAQEESLFNKPTIFSENYNEAKNFTLNNKDFKKLIELHASLHKNCAKHLNDKK